MNVAARQGKEKNEKTGKSKAGEERKQSTDFREAACCPYAVLQRAARQKTVCMREVPGVTGTIEKANSHFYPTQSVVEKHTTTLRRLFIGADHYAIVSIVSISHLCDLNELRQ